LKNKRSKLSAKSKAKRSKKSNHRINLSRSAKMRKRTALIAKSSKNRKIRVTSKKVPK